MSSEFFAWGTFEPDDWDAAGVDAEVVKAAIIQLVNYSLGQEGLPARQLTAIIDAAVEQSKFLAALKTGAAAVEEAIKFSSSPSSPQYQAAIATIATADAEASRAFSAASQILNEAKAVTTLVNNLSKIASNLGPIINAMQLGAAVNTGDSYEITGKSVEIIAGMAFGTLAVWAGGLVAGALGVATLPAWGTALLVITVGFGASKAFKWMWDNGAAEYYGIKKGDVFSASNTWKSICFLAKDALTSARNLFLSSEAQVSPLILDLDGDGVETTALASGIQFDHDTNGFAEKNAWVGTDDGLLVRDINGNGIIDNGTELFGNNTILKNGQKASNGFAALADLDENHDGKINANDTAYNQLRVWKDVNGDGITDQGELITLADAGVQSITTTYTTSSTVDANGNAHKQTGTFTRADGTTAVVDDVWFRMDAMYSTPNQLLAETDEIAALPELQGYGVVYSLHQAMLRDTDGTLKSLVEQFAAETDTTKRKDIMNQLLFAWTGSSELSPVRSDYAGYGNGLQIAVLEKLFADSYKNGAGSSGTGVQPLLDQSWNMVFNLYNWAYADSYECTTIRRRS